MNTGLTEANLDILRKACSHYPEIDSVMLFGSRAKGTYKPGSDVDIVIKGKNITRRTISLLLSELEDSLLPFFVDIVHYDTIGNNELVSHIDRVGVPL